MKKIIEMTNKYKENRAEIMELTSTEWESDDQGFYAEVIVDNLREYNKMLAREIRKELLV